MSQVNRTAAGGRIDRTQPLTFEFDAHRYVGHRGDTLASALLANGVHLVARSFKYHRPRGIVSAGAEEPNALVQLHVGNSPEPNVRATQLELYEGLRAESQNRWPSLTWDLGAVSDRLSWLMPAGFFYKTFMWPRSMWPRYEQAIRRMAGLGRAPSLPNSFAYEHMHAHCDVLVVGAGPAGLAAALAAGRSGARVILADDQCEPGGRLLSERSELDGRPALAWVSNVVEELGTLAHVRVLDRTCIAGCYDYNYLIGCQRFVTPEHGDEVHHPRERLWKIRARAVLLATGGIERPMVFPDNDRPGIMLAAAVRSYLHRYGVRAGRRIAVVTTADDGYRTALDLADAGAAIVTVADARNEVTGFLSRQVRARGIEIMPASSIIATAGTMAVESITLRSRDAGIRELGCDLIAMCGGWTPNVQLLGHAGGRIALEGGHAGLATRASPAMPRAGMAAGATSLREALEQGWECGRGAAAACGFTDVGPSPLPHAAEPEEAPSDWRDASRAAVSRRKQFVDYHTDVTVEDISAAVREGYDAPEHLKRYTTLGMGADQGKTGNVNALAVLMQSGAVTLESLSTTTYRPPYQPLAFGAIAGADVGELLDPVRTPPLHAWHARNGAKFETVGQWLRAWYYPRSGESLRQAVLRECKTVREGVGIFDASTLGKIDVQGNDAGEFLDRVYCNDIRSLRVGRCRYGLMLRQDGMVFDDGVIARLGENHYLLSTTTGGAARISIWLEDWLQTEWPDLKVYCTTVTENYAQIALAGPRCAEMLAPLVNLDLHAIPYMSVREAEVAGVPARIFRISFSGALGYELAVPAERALELWTTLMGAGERFGIAAYGTEAMHALRAEMGYIIVGQDTDGSVTPVDLGFEQMLKPDRFFIGKRSLRRSDLMRPDRKQLVGLLTEPADTELEEGAQIVAQPLSMPLRADECVASLGHVTSSYYSAECGRAIALALVQAGRSRVGQSLYAIGEGAPVRITVTATRFLDSRGGGG